MDQDTAMAKMWSEGVPLARAQPRRQRARRAGSLREFRELRRRLAAARETSPPAR
jgi:hypothetical protein